MPADRDSSAARVREPGAETKARQSLLRAECPDCGKMLCQTLEGRPRAHKCEPAKFRKGDKAVVVLRGAGVVTREDTEVWKVSKGIVYTTDSDYGYDAETGEWIGDDFMGWDRRIERAD